jgi:hypothetical protein
MSKASPIVIGIPKWTALLLAGLENAYQNNSFIQDITRAVSTLSNDHEESKGIPSKEIVILQSMEGQPPIEDGSKDVTRLWSPLPLVTVARCDDPFLPHDPIQKPFNARPYKYPRRTFPIKSQDLPPQMQTV